jgi:hypothetical protein
MKKNPTQKSFKKNKKLASQSCPHDKKESFWGIAV